MIGVHTYHDYKVGEIKKKMKAMERIIENSSYDFDIWLQRGCHYSGMDKFFGVDMDILKSASTEKLNEKLLNKEVTEYAFMSTGVAKGKGFDGEIIMNIYAPKGTKMMYLEPFSHYGNGSQSANWNGISKQATISREAEMLLQHGTKFKIRKIERKGDTIFVDLDVLEQGVNKIE